MSLFKKKNTKLKKIIFSIFPVCRASHLRGRRSRSICRPGLQTRLPGTKGLRPGTRLPADPLQL